MNKTGILISGVIGLVAVGAVAATTLSLSSAVGAEVAGMRTASAMQGGHGWRHGNRMRHICSPMRGEKLGQGISFVEAFMNFTTPQQQAWEGLAQALRAGEQRVGDACGTMKDGQMPVTATEKLALVETVLSAGLDIVVTVRPAFDKFYGTLNDKQQKSLDDLLSRRHHRG
jgi:hypothetical protein